MRESPKLKYVISPKKGFLTLPSLSIILNACSKSNSDPCKFGGKTLVGVASPVSFVSAKSDDNDDEDAVNEDWSDLDTDRDFFDPNSLLGLMPSFMADVYEYDENKILRVL